MLSPNGATASSVDRAHDVVGNCAAPLGLGNRFYLFSTGLRQWQKTSAPLGPRLAAKPKTLRKMADACDGRAFAILTADAVD